LQLQAFIKNLYLQLLGTAMRRYGSLGSMSRLHPNIDSSSVSSAKKNAAYCMTAQSQFAQQQELRQQTSAILPFQSYVSNSAQK
jgi:HPt (histidine-containing phosphotransfer) domain-containing protein